MKISVVTPTYQRQGWHELLYCVFDAQDWEDKELVVVDDSPEPSPFFSGLMDRRVVYRHARQRIPIGPKRDLLVRLARGEVIAHFDDDDYYAPDYLSWMHGELADHDAVKAGGFYIMSVLHDAFAYWDVVTEAPHHFKLAPSEPLHPVPVKDYSAEARARFHDNFLYGLGFSFMYRRTTAERCRFGDKHWGEDHEFLRAVDASGMSVRIVHDHAGHLCCFRHGEGSTLFPQYLLPEFVFAERFGAPGLAYLERVKALTGATRP
ncbi:MAG: glycosyltransferase [Deltaproteobacteria bacterium]|nr:glycosyltransferase [Deltaproteobacteria bacterium]